jgi:hypothetical protein
MRLYKIQQFKIFKPIFAISIVALISGCSYKTECYTPDAKQGYEEKNCYQYDNALISNHRFIYMNKTVWMQYRHHYLIEARDFNISVNDNNTTKTTTYTVLPSDHPLESYSNLLVNIDFIKAFDKVNSISYKVTNPQHEIEPQKLGSFSVKALNNILELAKSEDNKTK